MGKLDKSVERCLRKAESYAKREKDNEVRISHVIYGIINDTKKNFVLAILEELNVDIEMLLESVEIIKNENFIKNKAKNIKNSAELDMILNYAENNMISLENKEESSIEDLFFAVMHTSNELSQLFLDFAIEPITFMEAVVDLDSLFNNLDYVDADDMDEELYEYVAKSKATSNITHKNEALEKYCTNLNKLAIENKFGNCFGREKEIDLIYRILCRTRKSNPMLIGKAGVGKTNIVEGLAYNIVNGTAPDFLSDKIIFSLNLNNVVAGTKYRGMFEERIQGIVDELMKNENAILFIDEIHNIIGAGNAEGSLDLANILKPYIARKGFKIIGATTLDEYKKSVEKNKALQRRFAEVVIEEPKLDTCIDILNKLKPSFEELHNVNYEVSAIEACVYLSDKYLPYRTLPDKAIDLLDDVAVMKKLQKDTSSNLITLRKKYLDIEEIKKKIITTKCYEKAEEINKQSLQVLLNIKKEKGKIRKEKDNISTITAEDVKILIEEMTNIPVGNGGLDIKGLKSKIETEILGQQEAIDSIVKTLMINKLNIDDGDKPIGSFLFVGYSGVGKTQLSRKLCQSLFGSDNSLIRIDCSEYAQQHEVSKLIGAPAGFVGYDEGGILTNAIKRNPFAIILFDEIEKAHDKLFDILLQILGEGRLTDNQGETINFKNCIIIMTSNIGTKNAASTKIGFNDKSSGYIKNEVDKAITKRFRPEFINRIDNIVHFNILSKEVLAKILDLELIKLVNQVKKHDVVLKIAPNVKQLLVDESYIPTEGVRVLKRKINDEVKMLVVKKLLEEDCVEISLIIEDKKIKAV